MLQTPISLKLRPCNSVRTWVNENISNCKVMLDNGLWTVGYLMHMRKKIYQYYIFEYILYFVQIFAQKVFGNKHVNPQSMPGELKDNHDLALRSVPVHRRGMTNR